MLTPQISGRCPRTASSARRLHDELDRDVDLDLLRLDDANLLGHDDRFRRPAGAKERAGAEDGQGQECCLLSHGFPPVDGLGQTRKVRSLVVRSPRGRPAAPPLPGLRKDGSSDSEGVGARWVESGTARCTGILGDSESRVKHAGVRKGAAGVNAVAVAVACNIGMIEPQGKGRTGKHDGKNPKGDFSHVLARWSPARRHPAGGGCGRDAVGMHRPHGLAERRSSLQSQSVSVGLHRPHAFPPPSQPPPSCPLPRPGRGRSAS